ncbi:MAG: hypothetical protein HY841_09005 [Bacteroidetes bacterium]|nr:hypothetical protein [Bacteroidota bacterium]
MKIGTAMKIKKTKLKKQVSSKQEQEIIYDYNSGMKKKKLRKNIKSMIVSL